MIDRTLFASLMTHLGALSRQPVDRPTLSAYYKVLGHRMTDLEFEETVSILEAEVEFFPKVPAFLNAWRRTSAHRAMRAWRELRANDDLWRGFDAKNPRDLRFLSVKATIDHGSVIADTALQNVSLLLGADHDEARAEWVEAVAQRERHGPDSSRTLPDHTPAEVKRLTAGLVAAWDGA